MGKYSDIGYDRKLSARANVRRKRDIAGFWMLRFLGFAAVVNLSAMSEMAEVLGRGQLGEQNKGEDVDQKESSLHETQIKIIADP